MSCHFYRRWKWIRLSLLWKILLFFFCFFCFCFSIDNPLDLSFFWKEFFKPFHQLRHISCICLNAASYDCPPLRLRPQLNFGKTSIGLSEAHIAKDSFFFIFHFFAALILISIVICHGNLWPVTAQPVVIRRSCPYRHVMLYYLSV